MADLSPEVEEPLSLIHNLSREPSPIRSQTESQRLQSSSPRALIADVDKSLVSSTLNSLRIPSIVSQHFSNQIKSPKIHHPDEDTRTGNAQLSQSPLQSFRPSPPPISPHRGVDRGSTATLQSPQKTARPQRTQVTTPSPQTIKQDSVELSRKSLKSFGSAQNHKSSKNPSIISKNLEETIVEAITDLEPQGMSIREHIDELTQSVDKVTKSLEDPHSPIVTKNIEKIAKMSELLKNEANALRESIRSLSADIAQTKIELMSSKEDDVNFPYHLFLVEIVVNKIHMKCECFDIDFNNLVISAAFLGKPPIVLYDPSYGEIENFSKLNVGKSTLFAMTYDKICSIKEFEIILQLTKQPPCSSCVTKIGETIMDYTKEFYTLREELCRKWMEEQPEDSIVCTTSTPLSKNLYYLSCGDKEHQESIGVIEVSVRMSFLGKEITTTFCASPRPQGTSFLLKKDNGMTMYSCQKVEMDDQGKILLDESSLTKKAVHRKSYPLPPEKTLSPTSQMSSLVSSKRSYLPPTSNYNRDPDRRYDEIFTKMNVNELRIRVPKSTRVEREGRYDKIQELCSCQSNTYNAGEQIQFELPKDLCNPDKTHNTYTSNLKYTYKGCDKICESSKDRNVVNVTPSNCPAAVAMEKLLHPLKDVFILKIGKKLETQDKKTDLEIELVTPKAPSEKPVDQASMNNNISQQCSTIDVVKKKVKKVKGIKDKKSKEKSSKGKGSKSKKSKK